MAGRKAIPTAKRLSKMAIQRCSQPIESSSFNHCKSLCIVRPIHHGNNYENYQTKTKIPYVKIGAFVALSCGAMYEYQKTHRPNILHASDPEKPPAGPGGSSRRNTYNFVADVVEMSGSAVVFVERLARVPFSKQRIPISHGSGFIVESKGWIITNAHVVGNQSKLKVRLQDGREFEGLVIGVDEGMDLAAVEIKGSDLPYLPLGCSSDIRPGEWVVAMGSPLNLKNTVTAGIVSNIHRAGKELGLNDQDKREMQYIQTDAMINVGNSGGPLINLDGEVIGVNSMMASAGIGFAIPVDYVKDFLKRLNEAIRTRRRNSTGSASLQSRRRYIGITMLTLTEDIADQLRLRNPDFPDVTKGVLVHRVQYNSPADKAGMQDNDVIIRISGKDVYSTQDVFQALKSSSYIQITVRRSDKTVNLRVEPEDVL